MTTTLSNRVEGSVVEVREYETRFYPVAETTSQGWSAVMEAVRQDFDRPLTRSFNNPFPLSLTKGLEGGRYKGRMACRRGEEPWRVLDFDREIKGRASWGHTEIGEDGLDQSQRVICYRGDVLGVAVRIDTGEKTLMNTLKAFRSMYGSQKPAIKLKKPAALGGGGGGGGGGE
jgi:hypothetical protein